MTQDTEDVVARVKRLLPVSWTHEVDPATGEPMYADMTFGEHRTQAMSMDPDDWMTLNAVPDLIQSLSDRIDELKGLLGEAEEKLSGDAVINHDALCAKIRAALHKGGYCA